MNLDSAKKTIKGFFSVPSGKDVKELLWLLLLVFLIRTFGFGLYQVPSGSMETTMLVGERFFADKLSYLFVEPKHGDILSMNAPNYNYSSGYLMRLFEEYVWGPSNWTKRVIGMPGDTVKGTIENGRPVVYLNGKILDEPYLNKYPLISVWKEDPRKAKENAESKAFGLVARGRILPSAAPVWTERFLREHWRYQSYDPSKSWQNQPFYAIHPDRLYMGSEGEPDVLTPGTPKRQELPRQQCGKSYWNGSDTFYVELGPDEYWCMGDNRLGSSDSRVFGPFKRRLIHGRILFRIWSIDSDESWWIVDLIKHPFNFWQRVRWDRFFQWMY